MYSFISGAALCPVSYHVMAGQPHLATLVVHKLSDNTVLCIVQYHTTSRGMHIYIYIYICI